MYVVSRRVASGARSRRRLWREHEMVLELKRCSSRRRSLLKIYIRTHWCAIRCGGNLADGPSFSYIPHRRPSSSTASSSASMQTTKTVHSQTRNGPRAPAGARNRPLTRQVSILELIRPFIPPSLRQPLRFRVQTPPWSFIFPQRPRADDEQNHQSPHARRPLAPRVPPVVPRLLVVVVIRRQPIPAVSKLSLFLRFHAQRRRTGTAGGPGG